MKLYIKNLLKIIIYKYLLFEIILNKIKSKESKKSYLINMEEIVYLFFRRMLFISVTVLLEEERKIIYGSIFIIDCIWNLSRMW